MVLDVGAPSKPPPKGEASTVIIDEYSLRIGKVVSTFRRLNPTPKRLLTLKPQL
jgi:hypothetical protein